MADRMFHTTVELADLSAQYRLTVSDKSVLLASSPKLGRSVTKRLQKRKLPVKFSLNGVDLGVDVSAGKRRTVQKSRSQFSSPKFLPGHI